MTQGKWVYNLTDADLPELVLRAGRNAISDLSVADNSRQVSLWLRRLDGSYCCEHTPVCPTKAGCRALNYPTDAGRTDPGRTLAVAVRKYLYEDDYDPHPDLERHDTGCGVYDAMQHGPCDCGSDALVDALRTYEATL